MNKIDLEPHISEEQLIKELNLDYIVDNPWLVIPCSALRVINIEKGRCVCKDIKLYYVHFLLEINIFLYFYTYS